MTTLSFETTRRVYCEPGASAKLGPLMAELGASRVVLVTDPGVMKLGLPQAGLDSLKAAGIAVSIYDRTEADPPEKLVHEAVQAAKDRSIVMADDTVNKIKDRPLMAAGVATATALFIARKPLFATVRGWLRGDGKVDQQEQDDRGEMAVSTEGNA